jgi:hypothetical protein
MSIQNPNRHLADYLHRRLEFLGTCYAEIETKALDDDLTSKLNVSMT